MGGWGIVLDYSRQVPGESGQCVFGYVHCGGVGGDEFGGCFDGRSHAV